MKELINIATYNGASGTTCTTNMQFDQTNQIFTFDILLGECAMTAKTKVTNSVEYIYFEEVVLFVPLDHAVVFFGDIGTFTFGCNYEMAASTDERVYEVVNRRVGTTVEQFQKWDNGIGMQFFTGDDFLTTMPYNSLIVGKRFYFQVEWLESFSTEMPVIFYVSECTLDGATAAETFKLITGGCTSDITQTKRHSVAYSNSKVKLR